MSTPLCADRCQMVADLVAENARLRGLDERTGRIALGLTPVHIPPILRRRVHVQDRRGRVRRIPRLTEALT